MSHRNGMIGRMDLLMDVMAGVTGILMLLVGGFSIVAIWWDDLI